MEEKQFLISEAARLIGVEAHVLRYWEDELGLQIRRDEQGKRIYGAQDISLLLGIKKWRDKGIQLKTALEFVLQLEAPTEKQLDKPLQECREKQPAEAAPDQLDDTMETEALPEKLMDSTVAVQKFEELLNAILERALEQNNDRIIRGICDEVLEELDRRMFLWQRGQAECAAAVPQEKKRLGMKIRSWVEKLNR